MEYSVDEMMRDPRYWRDRDIEYIKRVTDILVEKHRGLDIGPSVSPTLANWQPIATATKDGTQVLLFFPERYQGSGGISWGCYIDGEWLDSMGIRDNGASHWAPMPSPPRVS